VGSSGTDELICGVVDIAVPGVPVELVLGGTTDVAVPGAGSPQTPFKPAPKRNKTVEYRPIMKSTSRMREKGNTAQSIYISHGNVQKPWLMLWLYLKHQSMERRAQLAWSDKATSEWGIKLAPSEGPSPLITEEIKPPRTKQFSLTIPLWANFPQHLGPLQGF